MDAQDLRALAQRCRELLRVASAPEVKTQLRDWVEDFEAEAEAIERGRPCYGIREHTEIAEGRPGQVAGPVRSSPSRDITLSGN